MPDIRPGLHPSAPVIDAAGWRWPHFTPRELACRCHRFCTGQYWHSPRFLDALEALRTDVGQPLVINSARRCPRHNRAVGGASASWHSRTLAVDIALQGHDRARLYHAAMQAGFTGMGFAATFLHLDQGPARRWTYGDALHGWTVALGFDPLRQAHR